MCLAQAAYIYYRGSVTTKIFTVLHLREDQITIPFLRCSLFLTEGMLSIYLITYKSISIDFIC